jgi:hypothetical protein
MRSRFALLGVVSVPLIVIVAGGLRLRSLEQRVATLEKSAQTQTLAQATRVGSAPVSYNWAPAGNGLTVDQLPRGSALVTSQHPNLSQFPNGATAHEINGMTYYVMPLADNGGATNRR